MESFIREGGLSFSGFCEETFQLGERKIPKQREGGVLSFWLCRGEDAVKMEGKYGVV